MSPAFLAGATIAIWSAAAMSALADEAVDTKLRAAVDACLQTNAPAVERAEPSLSAAVNFLVADLCAPQVALRLKYEMNVRTLDDLRKKADAPADDRFIDTDAQRQNAEANRAKLKAAYQRAYVDSRSGEIVTPDPPPNGDGAGFNAITSALTESLTSSVAANPDIRAEGARLLLDARTTRLKAEGK
jgi:hypothetical protein